MPIYCRFPMPDAGAQEQLREEKVDWLLSLLQSYPGSLWGNRETRGLDTDFASETYVETNLEETLFREIRQSADSTCSPMRQRW